MTLGNPTRRLDDGTGMDLKILKVLFEEIETRVSMPSIVIVVWSVEPFNGKAPALQHAGMTHALNSRDGAGRRFPPPSDRPHICSNVYVTLVHEMGVPTCRAVLVIR